MSRGELVVKSNIKKRVLELQNGNVDVSSIAVEVERALEKKVDDILVDAIERAKSNKRRTLQARDL